MELVYIVRTFPRLSETFVLREVAELMRRGEAVTVWSLLPEPNPGALDGFDAVAHAVRGVPGGRGRRAALATSTACAAIRRPRRFARAFAWATRWSLHERDPRHLAALPFAAYLAPRVPRGAHLHAHFANTPATVAILTGMLTGATCSWTGWARDLFAVTSPAFVAEKVRRAAFAAVQSEYSARRVRRWLLPAEGERVVVVRAGLPRGDMPARRADAALVLAVARLVPKKGLDTLVDAVAVLRDRGVAARCEIIGDGPQRAALAQRAAALGVGDRVLLAGAGGRAVVEDALARAAVFALPCRRMADGDEDNMPLAILEAMRAGVPVVTTPVAGIPEAVVDGRSGLVVAQDDAPALADAIARLLEDEALAARLAATARAVVAGDYDLVASVDALSARFAAASSTPIAYHRTTAATP